MDKGDRLESWKDVAAYLNRDVSTVQRWERREGLPIRRQQHDKLGSVYAFREEIDAWRAARSRAENPAGRPADTLATVPAPPEPEAAPERGVPAAPEPGRIGRRGWPRIAAAAAAAAILIAAGAWLTRPATTPASPAARPEVRSLVVLPFQNLTGDGAQEFFALGLTEELTSRLARVPALRVVSRTSAMNLQSRRASVATIARELDVDGVVEGSVRREGGRVRISIQLVDARSDTHVWAREFERDADQPWPVQIEVAEAAAALFDGGRSSGPALPEVAVPSGRAAAHEAYLVGRHLLWKFIDEDRARAIDHFERAIALDPTYARPYAALAHAWWMRGVFGPLGLKEVAAPAREAAVAALARDDRSAEAHAALAYVQGMFDWDWDRARTTVQRAVTLEPNSVDARYVHALLLMATGQLDDALAEIAYAARLDPLSAQVHSTYGRVLYRARRFEEARQRLERALELEPRNLSTYMRLAEVQEQLGRHDVALGLLAHIDGSANPGGRLLAVRARVLARAGRAREARALLARVPASNPQRAEVLAALGERDAAFRSLSSSLDRRDSWLLFVKTDPNFDVLHGDPRWTDVLRRMNLAK